jgi:hypothetical protein
MLNLRIISINKNDKMQRLEFQILNHKEMN